MFVDLRGKCTPKKKRDKGETHTVLLAGSYLLGVQKDCIHKRCCESAVQNTCTPDQALRMLFLCYIIPVNTLAIFNLSSKLAFSGTLTGILLTRR